MVSGPDQRGSLIQSGAFLTIAGFLVGVANYGFQILMGRLLPQEEWGLSQTCMGTVAVLSVPMTAATMALGHHLAHARSSGNAGRLEALARGSRRFLLWLSVGLSVLAAVFVQPLSVFLGLPRASLTLGVFFAGLGTVWGAYASGWFLGMAQFGRLALLGVASVLLRIGAGVLFGWRWHAAEAVLWASVASSLVFLWLLLRRPAAAGGEASVESPWDREFAVYFAACLAYAWGVYAFLQSDLLAAQRHLSDAERGSYAGAGLFGRSLVFFAGPLLQVLFTSRSEHDAQAGRGGRAALLLLHASALGAGAVTVYLLRDWLVRLLFKHDDPVAAGLVGAFALVMVPVGVLHAVSTLALGARQLAVPFVFGAAGLGYFLWIMGTPRSPTELLAAMRLAVIPSLLVVLAVWAWARRGAPAADGGG